MAILTNLDAIRGNGLDDLVRRVHHDKEDFVIEDQTMPVAAVIDINKYQLLTEMLQKAQGGMALAGRSRGCKAQISQLGKSRSTIWPATPWTICGIISRSLTRLSCMAPSPITTPMPTKWIK